MYVTTYPTEWFDGHIKGSIKEYKNYYAVTMYYNGKDHRKTFKFKDFNNNKHPAHEFALQHRVAKNTKHHLWKNKVRYIDENTMEMLLTQGQSTFFDSKNYDFIKEDVWHAKKAGIDDKKNPLYFAVNVDRGNLHNFISGYNDVVHLDKDYLNNREENLFNNEIILDSEDVSLNNLVKKRKRCDWNLPTNNLLEMNMRMETQPLSELSKDEHIHKKSNEDAFTLVDQLMKIEENKKKSSIWYNEKQKIIQDSKKMIEFFNKLDEFSKIKKEHQLSIMSFIQEERPLITISKPEMNKVVEILKIRAR